MGTPWPTPVCADMVLLPLLLLLGAVSTSHGALQQIKQGKKVVALFEGDENGEGKAWYPLYEGGFAKGIPNKRGKVSLPGGATYLGKFSKGKPVGKGRLVDLAKKKQKGKFSTMSEVINRMFTKDCDVGITFPDKVVTKGFPASCAERHNSTHKKILFLGNSYTGGNSGLPAKVISLARGAGFSASVSSVTPGGQTFAGHGSSSINTITGSADWDVVVLQGQSQRSSFGSGYVNYYIVPETVVLANAIKATNPCTVPLFYQTWGKRDGDSQNCGNHDLFCSYEGI